MQFFSKNAAALAALLGALAVVLGAFGAHGLKPHLSEYQVQIFEKGVQYHFYHVMALGLLGLRAVPTRRVGFAALFFFLGILFFSGSLYVLACKDLLPFNTAWAGPVTPIGGVCFILGWILLFLELRRS